MDRIRTLTKVASADDSGILTDPGVKPKITRHRLPSIKLHLGEILKVLGLVADGSITEKQARTLLRRYF